MSPHERPDQTEIQAGQSLLGLHMGLGGACQRSKSTRHLVTPIHHYALSYQPFSDAPIHHHHARQSNNLHELAFIHTVQQQRRRMGTQCLQHQLMNLFCFTPYSSGMQPYTGGLKSLLYCQLLNLLCCKKVSVVENSPLTPVLFTYTQALAGSVVVNNQ